MKPIFQTPDKRFFFFFINICNLGFCVHLEDVSISNASFTHLHTFKKYAVAHNMFSFTISLYPHFGTHPRVTAIAHLLLLLLLCEVCSKEVFRPLHTANDAIFHSHTNTKNTRFISDSSVSQQLPARKPPNNACLFHSRRLTLRSFSHSFQTTICERRTRRFEQQQSKTIALSLDIKAI